jgi:hypothetical protein
MTDSTDPPRRSGWDSDFPTFESAPPMRVRERLQAYVADASLEQKRAWADAIPPLQLEIGEVLRQNALASRYSAILEYELPMESRRPDVILLVGAGVMVIELKGKVDPSQADLDQASAYARDLRCYHRECAGREIVPVLVPTRAKGYQEERGGVHVTGPDALDGLVGDLARRKLEPVIDRAAFLADSAYQPLPTLVEAARELMRTGQLRRINQAYAATAPTVEEISRIVHVAAATKSRHLILVTGLPGAGKTLVGLQAVHAQYLDDLAVARNGAKPTAPAVFLSGNGPLVQVLQYELRQAGGDGKAFVRPVREYVKRYSSKKNPIPPEHVLVFDEAQRAHDSARSQQVHKREDIASEPAEFIRFADRIPEWCVVLGLIGSGQEIHIGEEAGIGQWRTAVEQSTKGGEWSIHVPSAVADEFAGTTVPLETRPVLALGTELRFHFSEDVHRLVAGVLATRPPAELSLLVESLGLKGVHFRVTRSLANAKAYLRDRYAGDLGARFGIVASSKDKSLDAFGVPNGYQATKRVKFGPWYGNAEDDYDGESCRRLETCVTEFGAQGLELDATLLAWGTDLRIVNGAWSNADAGKYKRGTVVKDALQLRINAYRVLLTRGRDGSIVFVPPIAEMDATFEYLSTAGFVGL